MRKQLVAGESKRERVLRGSDEMHNWPSSEVTGWRIEVRKNTKDKGYVGVEGFQTFECY